MGKSLRAMEPYYSGEYAAISDEDARARVSEAATAHAYRLQKGKVASNGIGKVILIAPVAERRVEDPPHSLAKY